MPLAVIPNGLIWCQRQRGRRDDCARMDETWRRRGRRGDFARTDETWRRRGRRGDFARTDEMWRRRGRRGDCVRMDEQWRRKYSRPEYAACEKFDEPRAKMDEETLPHQPGCGGIKAPSPSAQGCGEMSEGNTAWSRMSAGSEGGCCRVLSS